MKHIIITAITALYFSTAFCQQTSKDTLKNDRDIVFTKTEIEASFPGGESAWTAYVSGELKKNIKKLVKDNMSGTCRVRFIVDKDGSISSVEALTMRASVLAELVVKAISKGPKWIPAQQNGRFVKAFREQPVTFKIAEK